MLQEEKENYVASYFGPVKISRKNNQNLSNNMTLKNEFQFEIIKIILKTLKCVLVAVFQRVYFCFNLAAKHCKYFFRFIIIFYLLIQHRAQNIRNPSMFCSCMWVFLSPWISKCVCVCVCACMNGSVNSFTDPEFECFTLNMEVATKTSA